MASPWSQAGEPVPPPAQPLQPPVDRGQPAVPAEGFAPPPPGSPRRWVLIGMVGALLVVAIAATAAITYALSHSSDSPPTPSAEPALTGPSASSAPTPTYSQAEQAAAKAKLCHVFEVSVRGKEAQGGVVVNGDLNVPLVLRKVNSVVAVQNALTPAIPESLKSAVEKYVDTSMDLTTSALGDTPIDELRRLTEVGNEATYALADECGVSR